MREHTRLQQLLAVYDDLTVEERQRVERHLQSCRECVATLAAYRAMDAGVYGLVQAKLSDVATRSPVRSQAITSVEQPARRANDLLARVRSMALSRHYGMRLAGAVVFLLLLMILSALFGGWGPFDQPVLASTPTLEHQQAATAPASFDVHATPIAWMGVAGRPIDDQRLAPAPALPKPPVTLVVAATPPGMAFFNSHGAN